MLVSQLLCCTLLAVMGGSGMHADGVSGATRKNPEVPWWGDPDLAKVTDERVVQMWEDTVVSYRRQAFSGPTVAFGIGKAYSSLGLNTGDQSYLLTALDAELNKESINWEYVYTILILMLAGMDQTETVPELADYLFALPRPMKMSWAHGLSYKAMLELLSHQHSEASAAVLFAATYESYWGNDPLFSPWLSKNNRAESLDRLRNWALGFLMKLPMEISLPWLEKLAQDFPFDNVDKDRLALMYAGVMDTDLFIGKEVNAYLKKIYTQQNEDQVSISQNESPE